MIEVQNITKRYGDRTAIERVSFSVAKGEVLAFLGPNGAGKTTTMRILTCFMPPTELARGRIASGKHARAGRAKADRSAGEPPLPAADFQITEKPKCART